MLRKRSLEPGSKRRLLDDSLVYERAQFPMIVDIPGGNQLREVHDHEIFLRINLIRRVIGSAPAELPD